MLSMCCHPLCYPCAAIHLRYPCVQELEARVLIRYPCVQELEARVLIRYPCVQELEARVRSLLLSM